VRRFYATPDVARIVTEDHAYLSINIGSGHREHPLDTATSDEFYALRDLNVYTPLQSSDYTDPIVRGDLEDITDELNPVIPLDSAGWRLRLDLSPGEKVVTEARTFENTVFFTSFSPGGNGDACVAAGGLNRLYFISVIDGSPRTNLDGSSDSDPLSAEDRVRELNQGGIAPDPALFFTADDDGDDDDGDGDEECQGEDCEDDDDDCDLLVGAECFDPDFDNPARRTRWSQNGAE
jgi:type IV pilus assembly protein PilY1